MSYNGNKFISIKIILYNTNIKNMLCYNGYHNENINLN